jgi:hypothetical protein
MRLRKISKKQDEFKDIIERIDDIRELKFLKEKILRAERWEEFYSFVKDGDRSAGREKENSKNRKHENSRGKKSF